MKQNVEGQLFRIQINLFTCFPLFEPLEKCMAFKDIFPGLSRTSSFNFQDLPGAKWFSRTFQVLEFSRRKIQDFPRGVGRLNTRKSAGNCQVSRWDCKRGNDGGTPLLTTSVYMYVCSPSVQHNQSSAVRRGRLAAAYKPPSKSRWHW